LFTCQRILNRAREEEKAASTAESGSRGCGHGGGGRAEMFLFIAYVSVNNAGKSEEVIKFFLSLLPPLEDQVLEHRKAQTC